MTTNLIEGFSRRRALALMGGVGAGALLGSVSEGDAQAAGACVPVAAQQTEGPYWVEEMLNRVDVRVDPSDNSVRPGTLLALSMNIHEVTSAGCTALAGAHVDIWHCDAGGLYSDVAANNTVGRKFLRGYQISDDNGSVQFTTVYPGWYSGRTIHIHVRVRTYSGTQVVDVSTAQVFFDDAVTDQIFTQAPYNTRRARDTRNANDMVLTQTSGPVLYATLTQTPAGYAAAVDIGVNLKTAPAAKPAVTAGGVVNAASFQPGMAQGSWVSIFGQNLAAATRSLTQADLVNGNLPTTLGGVSVQVDAQSAYPVFVSPTQINALTPAGGASGSANVTVTNAAGTSAQAPVDFVVFQPAFFVSGVYVALANGNAGVKPGDSIELYGTGFGPTTPAIASGAIPSAALPLANDVAVTIGGAAAKVAFAGLSGAGLYQLNVTVPAMADGDHEVIAQVSGFRTPAGVLLKTKN